MAGGGVTTNWDVFFRVWAVVGPLLAGAVAAWWSRKNKIEDREYEKKLDSERFERECRLKEEEDKTIASEKEFSFVFSKIVNFISAEADYVNLVNEFTLIPVSQSDLSRKKEKMSKMFDANSEFIKRYTEVILVTNVALEKYAKNFFNASTQYCSYTINPEDSDKGKEKAMEWQNSKIKFHAAARAYLARYKSKITNFGKVSDH